MWKKLGMWKKLAIVSVIVVLMLFLVSCVTVIAGENHHAAAGSSPGFERFKALAGEWVGKASEGSEHTGGAPRLVFKVTSAGSAVEETMLPGSDHEMINMIHPDGEDIVLTHYCAIGNQPEMKAPDKIQGKDVAFKFVRCGNLKSPQDMHMHNVTYTFVDNDTLKTTWTTYEGGKPSGDVMVFLMKRKK